MTVDVVIPSYRPGEKFLKLLSMLEVQETPVNKIIVINTEKKYWRQEKYEKFAALEVHHIRKEEFDHGATRNMGVRFSKADIVVCMTDDAVPADRNLITALTEGFLQKGRGGEEVAEVYARQLASPDCPEGERYTRRFNYPEEDKVKTIADLKEMGIKTFFASNVCCAYKREVFEKLGGFIDRTIFNEDMIFASKTLRAGYAICYASKAKVVHSHNYTPLQQLHRNFDLGVSQADHPEVFQGIPSEGEGIRLVKNTAGYLISKKKYGLLPGLIANSGFKYLGYRLGKNYRRLPAPLVKRLTMNKNYWNSERR